MIQRRGVNVHRRVVQNWLNMFPHGWARAQRLTPAALPVSLVPHVSAQIAAYNANLPVENQVIVYLEESLRHALLVCSNSSLSHCLISLGIRVARLQAASSSSRYSEFMEVLPGTAGAQPDRDCTAASCCTVHPTCMALPSLPVAHALHGCCRTAYGLNVSHVPDTYPVLDSPQRTHAWALIAAPG